VIKKRNNRNRRVGSEGVMERRVRKVNKVGGSSVDGRYVWDDNKRFERGRVDRRRG
jgi:hypothetical protein